MSIEKRIHNISELSKVINLDSPDFRSLIQSAYNQNKWFTEENIIYSTNQLRNSFFNEEKLNEWLSDYDFRSLSKKTVGLVLSGNIPYVGIHDVLCTYLSGHTSLVKLSSKDEILMKYLVHSLYSIDIEVKDSLKIVDRLESFDAVIATGSNNSARYFNSYFKSYPNIIRKNRNGVAVLNGQETEEEIIALGNDMFRYFGLGCRNITKLFLPSGYDIPSLINHLQFYNQIKDHHKFKNNFDYQYSIHLLNQIEHYNGEFFILRENEEILSPISVFNYSFYKNEEELESSLTEKNDEIQCIVGNGKGYIPFGQAQNPVLSEYADGIDTIEFLLSL